LHSSTLFFQLVQKHYSLITICRILGINADQLAALFVISRRSAFYILNGRLSPPEEMRPLIQQLNDLAAIQLQADTAQNPGLSPETIAQLQQRRDYLRAKAIRQERLVGILETRANERPRAIWQMDGISMHHPDPEMQAHLNRWMETQRLKAQVSADPHTPITKLLEARAKLEGLRAEIQFIGSLLGDQNTP
jgi:hypothetical protein